MNSISITKWLIKVVFSLKCDLLQVKLGPVLLAPGDVRTDICQKYDIFGFKVPSYQNIIMSTSCFSMLGILANCLILSILTLYVPGAVKV